VYTRLVAAHDMFNGLVCRKVDGVGGTLIQSESVVALRFTRCPTEAYLRRR
jgi:hypothetical protein